jgi:hypothetical protein
MAAEVAANCVVGDMEPRSDECGYPVLVGHRVACDYILGTHLADERHGQGSDPVAGACEQQGYSMGDVCGDHPLLAVLVCVKKEDLPVYGKVPAGKVLWSVLISPITEELFFRGLMYNGFLFVGRKLRSKRAFETFVMLFVASVFAVAHARTGIYLTLTTVAGVVYGLCRLKSGSVIPAIVCHALFNALVMWTFGR